jgi:regulatory protein YycH of two-component signal transduction system YycFG
MLEKFKTVLLTFLVVLSLIQSYYLGFNKPQPNPINEPEYVRSEMMGKSLTMNELLMPKDIVLHFGENQHTILYPEEYFTQLILETLQDVEMDSIRPMSIFALDQDALRRERMGMEVRFHVPVSPGMLQDVIRIRNDALPTGREVRFDTIWFLKDANEAIRVYLISEQGAYEVENVDMTVRQLERSVTFGEYRVRYETDDGKVYRPVESIQVGHRVKLPYTQYTSEQLRNSLFMDPGISRSIMQLNNTEIITDGKRGLEIDHTQHWMRYSDPVPPADAEPDVEMNLNSALQFVNENGGWNGEYKLLGLPEGFAQDFRFIQYFESLPIIPTNKAKFGVIEVTMSNGLATGYERSIINPDWSKVERSTAKLPGGEALARMLSEYALAAYIVDLFPAYEAIISETSIVLEPRWAAELTDGRLEFIR